MHSGHRERMRERFEIEGLDAFGEHQVLEMMLFYAISQKDTNEIAHRLIERFGSFVKVLNAPVEELEKIEGMGHKSALFLKFIRSSYRYYRICETSQNPRLNTIGECAEYLMARLNGKRNEEVHLLCLDAKREVINCVKIDEGDACSTRVSVRKIIGTAVAENAISVVLAHNHPAGFALPSAEDVEVTQRLAKALQTVDVYLLDHIIVTNRDYVSLLKSGKYSPEACSVYLGI